MRTKIYLMSKNILDENKNLGQGEGNTADTEWQTL